MMNFEDILKALDEAIEQADVEKAEKALDELKNEPANNNK